MTGSCSDKRRLNTGFPFGKDRVLDWPSLDQFARNGKQTICLPVGTFRAPPAQRQVRRKFAPRNKNLDCVTGNAPHQTHSLSHCKKSKLMSQTKNFG
jgi:hypothetical protein